jgi:hypothetical protein
MQGIGVKAACLAMAALAAAACGSSGGDGGSGPQPDALTIQKAAASGDRQSDTVQRTLVTPLRVLVTRGGAPEAGAAVTWSDNSPGASFREASSQTDGTGIASTARTTSIRSAA